MNKAFLFLFAALVIILLIGNFVYSRRVRNNTTSAHSELNVEKATYRSDVHAFELEYPSSLKIREYSSESISFGTETGDVMDAEAEVRILTFEGEPGQSFQEVAGVQLMNLCAADGPGESFTCTDVISAKEIESTSGVKGYEYRLHGERKNFASNEIVEDPRGPFYVFPLAASATATQVVVVLPPLNRNSIDVSEAVISEMALSLQKTN